MLCLYVFGNHLYKKWNQLHFFLSWFHISLILLFFSPSSKKEQIFCCDCKSPFRNLLLLCFLMKLSASSATQTCYRHIRYLPIHIFIIYVTHCFIRSMIIYYKNIIEITLNRVNSIVLGTNCTIMP